MVQSAGNPQDTAQPSTTQAASRTKQTKSKYKPGRIEPEEADFRLKDYLVHFEQSEGRRPTDDEIADTLSIAGPAKGRRLNEGGHKALLAAGVAVGALAIGVDQASWAPIAGTISDSLSTLPGAHLLSWGLLGVPVIFAITLAVKGPTYVKAPLAAIGALLAFNAADLASSRTAIHDFNITEAAKDLPAEQLAEGQQLQTTIREAKVNIKALEADLPVQQARAAEKFRQCYGVELGQKEPEVHCFNDGKSVNDGAHIEYKAASARAAEIPGEIAEDQASISQGYERLEQIAGPTQAFGQHKNSQTGIFFALITLSTAAGSFMIRKAGGAVRDMSRKKLFRERPGAFVHDYAVRQLHDAGMKINSQQIDAIARRASEKALADIKLEHQRALEQMRLESERRALELELSGVTAGHEAQTAASIKMVKAEQGESARAFIKGLGKSRPANGPQRTGSAGALEPGRKVPA